MYPQLSITDCRICSISGPQDAASGFLKQQEDIAKLCGAVWIQTAEDLYKFSTDN